MKRFSMTAGMMTAVTMVAAMLMLAAVSLPVAAQAQSAAQGDAVQAGDVQAVTQGLTNTELLELVNREIAARNYVAALAAARALEASSEHDWAWAENAKTLAQTLWHMGRPDEAIAYVKSAIADPDRSHQRIEGIAGACHSLGQNLSHRVEFARLYMQNRGTATEHGVYLLFTGLVHDKKFDEALVVALEYGPDTVNLGPAWTRHERLKLFVQLRRADAATAEALEFVKVATHPMQAANAIQHLLPGGDVSLCVGLTAQQVLDGYKISLRRDTGRLNSESLVALANQLTKGGTGRPLVVTDAAKALAAQLGDADAPLAEFLQPLLCGDHAEAFRVAYARAKAAENDADYIMWINAAAGAIRCVDQHYNGRALDFVRFINGELDTNPAADLEAADKGVAK